MTTLKERLENEIAELNKKASHYRQKLDADFMHNFYWGYCGELYQTLLMKWELEKMISLIDHNPDKTKRNIETRIQSYTEFLCNGGYTQSSTNIYSNLAHTYSKEVDAKILGLLKEWVLDL